MIEENFEQDWTEMLRAQGREPQKMIEENFVQDATERL
jgi:hypothetical protein